jgi:hypothetical protein
LDPSAKLVQTEPVVPREVRIKFVDTEGQEIGDEIQVDTATSKIDLNKILDQILQPEEKQVYQFYIDGEKEVRASIGEVLDKIQAQQAKEGKKGAALT